MGIAVLHDRVKPIAQALHKARLEVGLDAHRPLAVAAFYLDSATDIPKALTSAKKEIGEIHAIVFPAPIRLDAARHAKIIAVLEKYNLKGSDARAALAEIVGQLT